MSLIIYLFINLFISHYLCSAFLLYFSVLFWNIMVITTIFWAHTMCQTALSLRLTCILTETYHLHFRDEAQRGEVTCPRSHHLSVFELGIDARSLCSLNLIFYCHWMVEVPALPCLINMCFGENHFKGRLWKGEQNWVISKPLLCFFCWGLFFMFVVISMN